jgi:hypothetical protein
MLSPVSCATCPTLAVLIAFLALMLRVQSGVNSRVKAYRAALEIAAAWPPAGRPAISPDAIKALCAIRDLKTQQAAKLRYFEIAFMHATFEAHLDQRHAQCLS